MVAVLFAMSCGGRGGGSDAGTGGLDASVRLRPCTVVLDCDDDDDCTNELCAQHVCRYVLVDRDGDGEGTIACGGADCDDAEPRIYGGAQEVCDGLDNDCDGTVDGPLAEESCAPGSCVNGACECPGALDWCEGACVDLETNPMHCGTCGHACIFGNLCIAGDCGSNCEVGQSCLTTLDCDSNGQCIEEVQIQMGGSIDPVLGLPGGGVITTSVWTGGYCVPAMPTPRRPTACDVIDPDSCTGCSACTDFGSGLTMCLESCRPTAVSNDVCRRGYACSYAFEACMPGCTLDEECRIFRADTNGNGVIDPFDSEDHPGGDNLVYDTASDATCDRRTYRCVHSGTPGSEAGDVCSAHSDCESNGICALAAEGWPGGYCTKTGCGPNRSCAGDGVCQERGFVAPLCLAPCTMGEPAGDAGDIFAQAAGCRPGYRCLWNGTEDRALNGGCVPGNFNPIRTPNVGGPCSRDRDCYSPFGMGQCFDPSFGAPNGYCTMLDCDAPGLPSDFCGPDAMCIELAPGISGCVSQCNQTNDCRPGFSCLDGFCFF